MPDNQEVLFSERPMVPSASTDAESTAVIPATTYAEMRASRTGLNREWTTRLATIKQEPYDLHAKIQLDESDKLLALERRDELRAFNGAPPTIPHPIDQMTSRGCVACHSEGLKTESLRAAKMPHPFFASCTQCHVEQNSRYVEAAIFRENSFAGLKAPKSGSRAFDIAPPVVPHTTWLRDDCLSCHGRTARHGLRTTHPWRHNCLQCHGVSSQLEQAGTASTPQFLPPPTLKEPDE
jgi:cytochrome c-type protein NapB